MNIERMRQAWERQSLCARRYVQRPDQNHPRGVFCPVAALLADAGYGCTEILAGVSASAQTVNVEALMASVNGPWSAAPKMSDLLYDRWRSTFRDIYGITDARVLEDIMNAVDRASTAPPAVAAEAVVQQIELEGSEFDPMLWERALRRIGDTVVSATVAGTKLGMYVGLMGDLTIESDADSAWTEEMSCGSEVVASGDGWFTWVTTPPEPVITGAYITFDVTVSQSDEMTVSVPVPGSLRVRKEVTTIESWTPEPWKADPGWSPEREAEAESGAMVPA